jgi:hypothetical protein
MKNFLRIKAQFSDARALGHVAPRSMLRITDYGLRVIVLLFLTITRCIAFPPAPDHLLFGQVRDEFGNQLVIKSAEVYLETTAGIRIKSQIVPGLEPGVNYKLPVSMDSGLTKDQYKPTALQSAVPFKMWVSANGTTYLPIEMKLTMSSLGRPGEKTRIDLTLGEDANGNGLPDAWERALIAASNGKLKEVRPSDDSDGDGMSNLDEYLAGTYAFDAKDGFSLKVLDVKASAPTLEFMSIRGRTYTVFGSSDLHQWTPTQFRLADDGADGADRQSYAAAESRVVRVSVRPSPEQSAIRFFKLRVE